MLKNISKLGNVLKKTEQQSINGGLRTTCPFAAPCPPNQIEYLCDCYYPWEI